MARGLSRIGRTPREATRDRRNAQRLGGAASLLFGGALAVDSSGLIVLNLQTLSGLDQDATGLTVVVQDVLAIDAAGLKLTFGTGLQSDGTTLTTKDTEIVHDNLSGFVGNEHIDHTSVTITTGVGLSGGGDISADRTFDLDILGLTTDVIAAGDWIAFHDLADEANKITFANFEGTLNHDALTNYAADEHIDWTGATENLLTTGNITIDSDASGIVFGDAQDATLQWDDAQGFLALNTGLGIDGGLTLSSGFIIDDSGTISFGDEDLVTTGTLAINSDITISSGSIVSASGTISFGDENLVTTGTLAVNNDITISSGSIVSASGTISFGDENLTTTGDITGASINLTNEIAAIKIDGTIIFKRPAGTNTICLGSSTGTPSGANNVLIGRYAGQDVGAGIRNMFLGAESGRHNDGSYNVGVGAAACYDSTGSYNTCIGYLAGRFQTATHTGNYNVCVGNGAGYQMQGAASQNTCLGWYAGHYISGNNNLCLGGQTGAIPNPLSGSSNIFIGYGTGPGAGGGAISSSIAMGEGAIPTASHQCLIGADTGGGYLTHFYLGNGVTSSGGRDIHVQSSGGSGTDNAAGDFYIIAGPSTGDADPGDIIFQTSVVGVSGAALQTLATRMTISDTAVTIQNGLVIPSGITPAPAVEGALFLDTDAGANGTLKCYSNGAWRTVTAF